MLPIKPLDTLFSVTPLEFLRLDGQGETYHLEAAATSDGRLVFDPNGGKGGKGEIYPEYHHRDHLGNTRVAFTDRDEDGKVELLGTNTEVVQHLDYYPFGMTQDMSCLYPAGGSDNRYRYNGKELVEEIGLYDYGARWYDPAVARWTSVDPSAENYYAYSPYNYVIGNPIRIIDPDGRDIYFAIQNNKIVFLGNDGQGDQIRIGEFDNKQAASIRKAIRKFSKGKASEEQTSLIRGESAGFATLEIESEESQNSKIDAISSGTKSDGKERGMTMLLSYDKDNNTASLFFGDPIVGENDKIPFILRGNSSNYSEGLKDENGNFVIGTVHTHKHDRGLSGNGKGDERSNAGDYSMVDVTQVPWFTVGPKKRHMGRINPYRGNVEDGIYKGNNMLKDALLTKSKR